MLRFLVGIYISNMISAEKLKKIKAINILNIGSDVIDVWLSKDDRKRYLKTHSRIKRSVQGRSGWVK